ncbi:MAG: acyl-CoA thioesterase [Gammaproteobacteria bacterium]|jgi:1,4-dihydroxy-2-naphthoyl-CoA hydrolase|nr:acyl-CoA thioesterase [Gammaproteobacteria bacterium]MBT4605730.1 acyl-CoA thioesterase [Thiotrichales bacterium]MBT3472811.1 acyl-CoA thioesterase [Gammaproteobacteria bacterium]MBT3966792.1 acyl-CoA thioesterase [Gammaproteobacteria bacterium]MBT4079947.1 acyl-CoA thioesterase [Gammaproteobacteria bacterium]
MSTADTFPFQHPHTVRLYETDGAGILFYGQIFTLVHNAHEELLASVGLSPQIIFEEHPFSIPLAHAEADYLNPIQLSEKLTLSVSVEKIGERSFTLLTRVSGTEEEKAVVTTVHVTIDQQSGVAIPLPEPILQLLNGRG